MLLWRSSYVLAAGKESFLLGFLLGKMNWSFGCKFALQGIFLNLFGVAA